MSNEQLSEKHIRSVLNQSLIASGEKEKLLDLLKVKLIECGWRNEVIILFFHLKLIICIIYT